MENYADVIIDNYRKKLNLIQHNMNTTGIFPDRNEPLKVLDCGHEAVLKTIFRLKVSFLEELTILFAYCYSKQKFEALIADLEAQGYIKSKVSKDYGKYFTLTQKALYYIHTDRKTPFSECHISEDPFPNESKLIYHKCVNGYFSNQVFQRLTDKYWNEYLTQDKDFRKEYPRQQFIKQFVYSQTDKNAYSKTEADSFAKSYMPTLNEDEELLQKYKNFVRYFKEHDSDTMLRFNFLKDFYNSLKLGREQAVKNALEELSRIFNNIYRDRSFTYRTKLYELSGNSPGVKAEFDLYTINELLRNMLIIKKSLLNTQKSEKSEDKLQEILQRIEDIEQRTELLTRTKETLEKGFETLVFDKYSVRDIPQFIETNITLDTLSNMKVYITGLNKGESGKYCLEFSIFQPTIEEMSVSYLFKRFEAIFKFYRSYLFMFDYRIKVVTHTQKQKEQLETKIATIREDFEMFPEYQMLLLAFDDGIEVVATKQHLKERFETFKELGKYI